ncbi:asparagine synthase (glutamine-hydrolyzing) [Chitinophaga sp.]|uniref:asparagine synthase (glutamine-hydrolyzing) n=1 Tax=Chitinophaga sp. TaxID=1869181 RepID=UPI0031E19A09
MCGIVGIFDKTRQRLVNRQYLEKMTSCLLHRGPDDEGYVIHNSTGLGFRRLSIIDLSGGRQPMYNEDGTLALVCNGEIYNYKELRREMIQKGHRFASDCDVEVILHLYEEEGTGFIKRLNGQFAFAIFDMKKDCLITARDQVGIAPLFYTTVNDYFLFSSEIKALLQYPGIRKEVNLTCLDQILSFPGYVSPATMFKDIHSLKPGHYLYVDRHGMSCHEYWDIKFTAREDQLNLHSEQYYVDQLEELLLQAVKYRLHADVPVGFYLSGGLDSSLIAAMIHRLKGGNMHSFSVAFEEHEISERIYQQQVCAHLGQEAFHHEVMFTPDDIAERLRQAIYFAECPLKESYNTCSLALSAAVNKKGLKVILTGEGADELFAGYVGYRFDRIRTSDDFAGAEMVLEEELREKMWGDRGLLYEKNYHAFRDIKRAVFADRVNQQYEHFDCFTDTIVNKARISGWDLLQKRSYLDFKLRLADHLISDHGDRVAYANSVEARYPFLDINVIEFAASLPSHLKLNGLVEKYLLKKCAAKYLPASIVNREKFGFVAPGCHYLMKKNIEWVNDLLSASTIKRQGYFNVETVERLKKTYMQDGFRLHQVFETDFLMIILTFGLLQEIFDLPAYS